MRSPEWLQPQDQGRQLPMWQSGMPTTRLTLLLRGRAVRPLDQLPIGADSGGSWGPRPSICQLNVTCAAATVLCLMVAGLHCSHLSSALAKLGSPGLAVEVGCGGGHSTLYLAASGWRAVGLDVSEHAIARAASLAAELSVPVAKDLEAFAAAPPGTAVFFCADILKSDVPGSILGRISPSGAGVDLLFDCQTFHVLRFIDESRAASAYAELVRPGGKLIM